MSKKSYAKLIIDLSILPPDLIKENLKIRIGKNVSEQVLEGILIKVLEKISDNLDLEEWAKKLEERFNEKEMEAIIKYILYFKNDAKWQIENFYKELFKVITEETKPYVKDE
jgi:hypothetical protein